MSILEEAKIATVMDIPVRYWQMHQLSLNQGRGYEVRAVPVAKSFMQSEFADRLPQSLLYLFQNSDTVTDVRTQAVSGLCLRCYVSQPIVRACQKLANLFGTTEQFNYRDLLPFVLSDDSKRLWVVSEDGQTCLYVDGQIQQTDYESFSVTVLKTYQTDSATAMSLENWTYLKTKQYPELKKFLSEFGFQQLSDWAMLNRTRKRHLESLSARDRVLIKIFHQVYRRDRQRQTAKSHTRCPIPTLAQLTEMMELLQQEAIAFGAERDLLNALKDVATQLRQFDVWQSREPLDYFNTESGHYETRSDLPTTSVTLESNEEDALLSSLREQLVQVLPTSLQRVLVARLAKLKKSRKYAPFADKFVVGLQSIIAMVLRSKSWLPGWV